MQSVKRVGVVHCKTKKMKKDCGENVEVLYDRFATQLIKAFHQINRTSSGC